LIGIVDYGLGNVRAFENIYRRFGIPAASVKTAEEIDGCERLILPGVGAFDWAMTRLAASGMLEKLVDHAQVKKTPVLGVCVGMQIMANSSEEGSMAGLGWIPGRVERFKTEWFNQSTQLPHMGWNDVSVAEGNMIFSGLSAPRFYFLHSYFFHADSERDVIATTHYGRSFASAVRRENIWATQFHPEKSHGWGIQLLRNFADA
jgi:glutamine amidotransferase